MKKNLARLLSQSRAAPRRSSSTARSPCCIPETVKAFSAIAQEEPTCAMAYWGIAISQRPNPLVGPFPGNVLKAGQEAIEKARAAQPKTERERGWIEALAAFYHDYEQIP
jgi:hypothetical protein